ncbi:MAG TPA: hypothetical protein VI432_01430 [Candidatus Paceibacterota bacterium]
MAKNNTKNLIYIVGGLLIIGGLFAWPIITDETRASVKDWNKAGVGCLLGHQQVVSHIHQQLLITVDGEEETIPPNTGIARGCMAEIHVHEGEANILHVETAVAGKEMKLGHFFAVYDKPINRDGYDLIMGVNGEAYEGDPLEFVLQDQQVIEIEYNSETAQ